MTKDDIIRMAQDSGLKFREHLDEFFSLLCDGVYFEDLEDFAKLVAAAEREAIASILDEYDHKVAPSLMAKAIRARGQE